MSCRARMSLVWRREDWFITTDKTGNLSCIPSFIADFLWNIQTVKTCLKNTIITFLWISVSKIIIKNRITSFTKCFPFAKYYLFLLTNIYKYNAIWKVFKIFRGKCKILPLFLSQVLRVPFRVFRLGHWQTSKSTSSTPQLFPWWCKAYSAPIN